jgi:phage terminase large subunit-like protein
MNDPRITTDWTLNASDEKAVANGCWFDPLVGGYVVWWIERYCRLYEGDHAGEPMVLRGLHSDALDTWPAADEFDEAAALERAAAYIAGKRAGEACDWQYETIMRLFGWQRRTPRYDRPIRRFTRGGIWVPKKNKKSPTLAAVGLYLLCGDGEPGQKVFFGAKDGAQAAEIAGKHAIEMVLASEELGAECEINKTEKRISHVTTRSSLKPMSSGDARTHKSKEGINGSVLIDETHVVDADFIAIIKRAGISRAEPFHLEFSTAGRNPDCYGKGEYDRGRRIESGSETDQSYFFVAYEAKASDDEIHADPVRYGRLANPAWGHTVHEEEFLADYNSSKKSIADFADFKTYRLNIWQTSRNPWLQSSDWDACGEAFTLEDFRGEACWAGMDLSKTYDMSAVVLTFRRDGLFWQFPVFWLPEQTAHKHKSEAAFLDWHKQGHLRLIPGRTIDQSFIEEWFAQAKDEFALQEVWYDKTYAYDLTQRLERDHGIARVEFSQTNAMYAGPVDEYEKTVIAHELRHPRHPILTWQAGHCEVTQDARGRRILAKPPRESIKKIDGMAAGVMSLHGAKMAGEVGSVYESRGVLTLGGEPEPERNWLNTPDWANDDD